MTTDLRYRLFALLIGLGLALQAPAAMAASEAQELVDKARLTTEKMFNHPDTKSLRGWVKKAKGVLIIPSLLKAGFVFGGEGGRGVLLAKDADGNWSPPAFYALGSGSIGLQIGFQDSEVVLVIMTDGALEAIISAKIKLGVDVSVAVGPKGLGVEGATTTNLGADILAYSLTRGAFLGASFEGSVAVEEDELNTIYYGSGATARGIVLQRKFSNSAAAGLIRALKGD